MSTELKKIIEKDIKKLEKDIKKRNITPVSVMNTVKNSLSGIVFYAKDGKSIVLYIFGLIYEIIMGIIFKINGLEWILIICMMGILLSVELLNTSIEAACDAITKHYNPLIKIAKDCGSAATFIIFSVLVILNLIIFIPKIMILF